MREIDKEENSSTDDRIKCIVPTFPPSLPISCAFLIDRSVFTLISVFLSSQAIFHSLCFLIFSPLWFCFFFGFFLFHRLPLRSGIKEAIRKSSTEITEIAPYLVLISILTLHMNWIIDDNIM